MKFIFFLKYCKFSHFEKKKKSDAAAKSDARGDEKHFYFFTWPKLEPMGQSNYSFFSAFFKANHTINDVIKITSQ